MSRKRKANRGDPRRAAESLRELADDGFELAAALDECGCRGCRKVAGLIRRSAARFSRGQSVTAEEFCPRWAEREWCRRTGERAVGMPL